MLPKILDKVFITKKCIQRKTLHTLKNVVFELPDNKNVEKLFSKYELLSLNQPDFISDPTKTLILQYLFPAASLPP